MTDRAVAQLAGRIGVQDARLAVGASQAGYYRRHRLNPPPQRAAPIPHRQRRPGSSMTSKPAAFLLADLGVTQSHSRPHVQRQPVQ
jgi:putative transposase